MFELERGDYSMKWEILSRVMHRSEVLFLTKWCKRSYLMLHNMHWRGGYLPRPWLDSFIVHSCLTPHGPWYLRPRGITSSGLLSLNHYTWNQCNLEVSLIFVYILYNQTQYKGAHFCSTKLCLLKIHLPTHNNNIFFNIEKKIYIFFIWYIYIYIYI